MTATLPLAHPTARVPAALPFGLLADLERPADAVAHLTPNWFAAVMGTGIVATAAASLPVRVPGLHTVAIGMWALAAALLVVLLGATTAHWGRHAATARGHLRHPVLAHFYGAPAMAALTVGASTLLVGRDVLGAPAAVAVDRVLWAVGTAGGLLTAVLVPYLHHVRRRTRIADAFGGWLMPVVPPMVSASTGALLVPSTPSGDARTALLLSCYAMFALALVASLPVIVVIVLRLLRHGVGPAAAVPTYWIVLGPLGQSVTAAGLLGAAARETLPARDARVLQAFGIGYGVPVLGLAAAWAVVATVLTVRTARRGLPFSLAWWSFTFPVGTCVTGATGLAVHTGDAAFRWAAVVGFAVLCVAWLIVAARTAGGTARGRLLLPTGLPAASAH